VVARIVKQKLQEIGSVQQGQAGAAAGSKKSPGAPGIKPDAIMALQARM
jgi:hypothetical protein